jgi:hypothetical protein
MKEKRLKQIRHGPHPQKQAPKQKGEKSEKRRRKPAKPQHRQNSEWKEFWFQILLNTIQRSRPTEASEPNQPPALQVVRTRARRQRLPLSAGDAPIPNADPVQQQPQLGPDSFVQAAAAERFQELPAAASG